MDKKKINQECILFFKEKIEQLERERYKNESEHPDLVSEYYSIMHHLISLQNKISTPGISVELYTYAVDYFTCKDDMYDKDDVMLDFYQMITLEKDYLLLYKIYNEKSKIAHPKQIYNEVKNNGKSDIDLDSDMLDKYKDLFIIYHNLFRFDIVLENLFGITNVTSVLKGEDHKKSRKQIQAWITELEHVADEDSILENFINILTTYLQFRYCMIYNKEFVPSYLKVIE